MGTSDKSKKELERLGRSLKNIFETDYISQWRVYKVNFVRGVFFGLGAALGGSLVIAIIIWILSLFSQVPLIGNFVDTIRESLHEETSLTQ